MLTEEDKTALNLTSIGVLKIWEKIRSGLSFDLTPIQNQLTSIETKISNLESLINDLTLPPSPYQLFGGEVIWIDAMDLDGQAENSGVVNWVAKNNGGVLSIPFGSIAPTLKKNQINGKSAIQFSGNNQLVLPTYNQNINAFAAWFVVKTPLETKYLFDSAPGEPNVIREVDINKWELWNDSPSVVVPSSAEWRLLTIRATTIPNRKLEIYINGVLFNSGTSTDTNLLRVSTPRIGSVNSQAQWQGLLAAMAMRFDDNIDALAFNNNAFKLRFNL